MTALTRYQRLESPGVWHESPQSQRRDVTVALGEATLILRDRADSALTHWSLAAVVRINTGDEPAIFAPGPEDGERLEIADAEMIAALDTIRRAVARGTPRRGLLRRAGLAAAALAVAAGLAWWLPGALVTHTAAALPQSSRQEIGRRMVIALEPQMGRPCRNIEGRRALETLRGRLFGDAPWQVRVLETGRGAVALPGGILVLGGEVLQMPVGPEAAAGHLLAAAERAAQQDRMQWLLQRAGPWATLQLLTSGTLPEPVLEEAAQALALGADLNFTDPGGVLARFRDTGVSSRAYGMSADPEGAAWTEMVEADPWPAGGPDPVLQDASWLRLQGICD